jgi:hypothetical protein
MGTTLVATNGIFVSTGGINVVYASKDGGKTWTKTQMETYINTLSVIGQTFYVPIRVPPQGTLVLSSRDGINFGVYYSAFAMRQKRFPPKNLYCFLLHIDFSSFILPSGPDEVSAISHVIGSRDGSICVLVSAYLQGLILRSETVANPQWKITFQGLNYLGYGYFARIPSSDSLYVSIPDAHKKAWVYLLSRDNGQTWASYSDYHIGFGPITSAGENLLVFGEAGKLSVSIDGGKHWIPHDEGITEPRDFSIKAVSKPLASVFLPLSVFQLYERHCLCRSHVSAASIYQPSNALHRR